MTADPPLIAVTGAAGRLGHALLQVSGRRMTPWSRPLIDLDEPSSLVMLLDRDRPALVIHTAAMTDVDACAREPALARRRNGEAVGVLAEACRSRGTGLVVVSTNEVFDGERQDGRGYTELDDPRPINPYGASKLAGEDAARSVFGDEAGLWIVRTAWLFGPPGNDFPDKITRAADMLAAAEALPVVSDEVGSPTFARDLAVAILLLVDRTEGGLFHLVNQGRASRFEWAARVLATRRPARQVRAIASSDHMRASRPPRWAVLDAAKAASVAAITLRSWADALTEHLEAEPRTGWGQVDRPAVTFVSPDHDPT